MRYLLSCMRLGYLCNIMLALFIALTANTAFGIPAKQKKGDQGLVPAILLKWPKNSSDYVVMVDKFAQKAFLYNKHNLYKPERIYNVSTGENNGPKSKTNDRKTPEGIYFFTNSFVERELAPIYGARAFPINYPNSIDKKEGRSGYGIWFHGTNKPLKPRDSNGCIVLTNRDINELATFIKLNNTPVIISSRIGRVHPDKLEKERRELETIIENWRRAWEGKNIEGYMSFYHRKFTSGGKDVKQWKRYKSRLNKRYKRIRVEIADLQLLENDGLVMANFSQTYRTSGFKSQGLKRLYLRKNSNQWRIIGEFFSKAKRPKTHPRKPVLSSLRDIKDLIYRWKDAWEKKDLKMYISYYDTGFRSRGMDLKAWKRHRERLNRRYRSLKIDINGLKVVRSSTNTAKVSFKQAYKADRYRDFGKKKLVLVKRGKNWKITEESWAPIKRRTRP